MDIYRLIETKKPYEVMEVLYFQRESWSNEQILAELIESSPLMSEEEWDKVVDPYESYRLFLYVVLAGLCAQRHMREAIIPLLERAGFGDLSETMRGLRSILLEIVDGKSEDLIEPCLLAATLPQPGCRMWALNILEMFLDRPEVRTVFINALNDDEAGIRNGAQYALKEYKNPDEGYPRPLTEF